MKQRLSAILSLDVVGYTARMARDRTGTLKALNDVLNGTVRPAVAHHGGHIFKLMGDGALVEFQTAGGAIRATHRILQDLRRGTLLLRAGIDVGDVTLGSGDIFGDPVNLAARLQAAAPAGGCLVSRSAVETAGPSLEITLKSESAMRFKGLGSPVNAYSIDLDGGMRLAQLSRLAASQVIRFTRSADGTSIAWSATGEGQTMVKAPHWLQHLELEWTGNPLEGWLPHLSQRYRLIRFDGRNNGMSDRGVEDISLERFIQDLDAVFDAAEIERAPLFGLSYGATIAAAFAALRPERVSALVLLSGFAQGLKRRGRPADAALGKAIMDLSRDGWDNEYPSSRDLMAQSFAPSASPQDQREYATFMKQAMNLEDWLKVGGIVDNVDISDLLGKIRCPALVLHPTRERMHSSDQGRRLAAGIPNARFVALDTANNTMPVYDSAWSLALREIDDFLNTA